MNGFNFDNISCATFGIKVKHKSRPVLPTVADSYTQLPGKHGSYLFSGNLDDRIIVIDCVLVQDTLENLRANIRSIAAWLYTTERKSLSFDDELGKYYMAKLDDAIDVEQTVTLGEFTLKFRCEPLCYGAGQYVNFVNNTAVLTNVGTFEAFPKFSVNFTAPASEWKVTLGNKYVRVVHGFQIGNILEIDCYTGAVLVNTANALINLDWQNSEFFTLQPGDNTLTITPHGVCTATLSFTPRWL